MSLGLGGGGREYPSGQTQTQNLKLVWERRGTMENSAPPPKVFRQYNKSGRCDDVLSGLWLDAEMC